MSSDGPEILVGIDLGTTFSLVAYADQSGPQIIRDENGEGRLPSVVALLPAADGEQPTVAIGWAARDHAVENPRTTVYSVKRLMGKGMADVAQESSFLAYSLDAGPRQTVQIEIGGRRYTPEQVSALILRALKERAERHLGRPVEKAVITVPAYFDDAQRQATRDAGQAAGLNVVRIINEPTAAALAYGIGLRKARSHEATEPRRAGEQGTAGGGQPRRAGTGVERVGLPIPQCHEPDGREAGFTSEAAKESELVAVYDLGGGTFDISILRLEDGVFQVLSTAGDTHLGGDDFDRAIVELVGREVHEQFGLSIESPAGKQALRLLAENVKIRLSEQERADLELELGQGRRYRRTLSRAAFESLIEGLLERTLERCRGALRDARVSPRDVDQVVLVGGSTRMPIVRRRVAEMFGRQPYTALNPDEVVALGAALQASLLSGVKLDMLLLDVTPLSLGIETMGGAMGKLILRNTTIPCRATEMFTTFVDGQTAIKLNVLQGERELAADCRSLGEFELRGIPPMPAGIPKLEVEFLIDANGILNVSATEQRSGQSASIQIVPNRGLTRAEVERMMQESLAFARQDIDAHRRVDLVNQVQFDTQKAEQMLAKVGHLLEAAERRRLERDIAALRTLAQQTQDLDELHRALEAFGKSTVHLAELGIRQALVGAERADGRSK